jgi:hypothetical protein
MDGTIVVTSAAGVASGDAVPGAVTAGLGGGAISGRLLAALLGVAFLTATAVVVTVAYRFSAADAEAHASPAG